MPKRLRRGLLPALLFWSLAAAPGLAAEAPRTLREQSLLPTGLHLDPAGESFDLGSLPLAMALSPGGDRLAVLLSGWREQGVQIVEPRTGRVVQTLPQTAAFLGLAFAADGTLYASGGNEDQVVRYSLKDGLMAPAGTLALAPKEAGKEATRYPAGLALSPDGRRLYVAENVGDSLAVMELPDGRIVQRLPAGHSPYGVAVSRDGTVFVSAWGERHVAVFRPDGTGSLAAVRRVEVGRHPSALLLNPAGTRLFVASASTDRVVVVDTARLRVVRTLADPPPSGPGEGSTPNALALSKDGARLFVAEADSNAVAVFGLSAATSGVASAKGRDCLLGRIPAGWYPSGVLAVGDSLLVLNAKGRGTAPNPGMVQPKDKLPKDSHYYTLGQINGTLSVLPFSDLKNLQALSQRVARANGWGRPRQAPRYPPFEHVVYIIKENRTYDQVLSDLPQGDGDTSLLFFPREVSPNHHALAERFGLFDRFFTNAEVSNQGHPWSMSGYVTDYTEKTTPSSYSDRRPQPPDEGETDEPASGFLWDSALRKGIGLRVYGEYAVVEKKTTRSQKKSIAPFTSAEYPAYDLSIQDQRRADAWIADLQGFVKSGRMPALEILHLPNDHTAGARPGLPTPRAYMADNDLALGRLVEALSRTPFWRTTAVFVLEDDAQAGPDHVDSHRSVLLVISPYNRPGVVHRFANTTDVLATIEEILGLGSLSQFDHFGRPLRELFTAEPDLSPYTALVPAVPLTETNPANGPAAKESALLDLRSPDASPDELFNRILWRTLKGDVVAMPPPRRLPLLELIRSR
ncbi:MAG: bifunctional YncE family protein/alkaline phosphatase family protein [Acidobacteria bacterium]|nr:bifunctional YncE family protein/alkaline phosphatase family protein [Acidobacteriota bacterium]